MLEQFEEEKIIYKPLEDTFLINTSFSKKKKQLFYYKNNNLIQALIFTLLFLLFVTMPSLLTIA